MITYIDEGKGRVYTEIDVLKNKENRLEQLRKEMEKSTQNEIEYLKQSFAYNFFIKLAYLRKTKKYGNEVLAEMATELLEKKRKALSPLEGIVKKLGGE